jgi:chitin synthase
MSPTSRTRDSHQVLTLPTPLSVARPPVTTTSTAISGSSGFSRSSEEGYAPPRSNSNSRLVGSQSGYDDPYEAPAAPQPVRYSPAGGYDATSPRSPPPRSRVTSPTAGYGSPTQYSSPTQQYAPPTQYASQSSDPAPQRPRRSQPPPASAYSSETEEPSRGRGVSLTDAGPVQQQPDAVRRVPRSRRPTSQTPQQSQQQSQQQARTLSPTGFSSASAQAYGLPPGAAPPQAQQEYRRGPPAAPQQHRGGSLPPGAAAPQRGTGAPRSYGVGRYVD